MLLFYNTQKDLTICCCFLDIFDERSGAVLYFLQNTGKVSVSRFLDIAYCKHCESELQNGDYVYVDDDNCNIVGCEFCMEILLEIWKQNHKYTVQTNQKKIVDKQKI